MSSAATARASAAQLLVHGATVLADAGVENPRREAATILAHAAGVPRAQVVSASLALDDPATARFYAILKRRAAREPLAYIVGHQEFFSLDLDVSPAVLIPRPETESLVEIALTLLQPRHHPRVLDLATGSGAIAVTLACNDQDAWIVATDVSADALAIARRNARRHRVDARIEFRLGSWFEPLHDSPPPPPFELIVSNP
ncbi:MAG: N5-glutamine methyltransferase family protein, partial [Candidatus Binataceae bacterium]